MEKCAVPNALADLILLVGLDDNTGLTPSQKPTGDVLQSVFSCDFMPQVISAISATDMVNNFPFPHPVSDYPPDKQPVSPFNGMEKQRDMMFNSYSGRTISNTSFHPKKAKVNNTVNPALLARHMSVRLTTNIKTPTTLPELPISKERLQSMPFLCFPEGIKIYRRQPEDRVHFVVLTDINGKYSYGTCLTFYRSFSLEKDDQENLYVEFEPKSSAENLEEGKVRCYIPHCLIMCSQFPYYTQMKDCLSSLVKCIYRDPEEMVMFLKDYAHILTNTPVPPPGNVSLVFDLYKLPVTLMPPSHPGKPYIDFPLYIIFSIFKAEDFLRILACVLKEESIVFMSANHAILTYIMEGVRNLIFPFGWRFSYSPVLPDIGFLQALNPFLFGCHSRYRQEAEQVPGLVIVDIDQGHVTSVLDEDGELCDMKLPDDASNMFLMKANKYCINFDFIEAESPSCFSIEEIRAGRMKRIEETNEVIINSCLELMVNLFRGVVTKLNVEHKHFNREQFLNELEPTDKGFYEKVFQTDMFKIFLEQRINEVQDYWYDLEIRSRGICRSKSVPSITQVNKRVLRKQNTISQIFVNDKREITPYNLPDPADRKLFIKCGIKELSKQVKECPDYDSRSSYLYLRAMFHVAEGNKMAALSDLINLSITDIKLIPVNVLTDLYKQLTPEEVTQFKKLPDHAFLLDIIEEHLSEGHLLGNSDHSMRRVRMDPIQIPDRDLNMEEFQEYVALEMTNDFDTIQRLFSALTGDRRQSYIDRETFQTFVGMWQINQEQCDSIKVDEAHLREDESILKVSATHKTDYGLGRLVLTDRRLFFLSDVSSHYREVTLLRDIISITKSRLSTVFSNVDVLQIQSSRKGMFTAYLKEEQDCWYHVVMEMWAGKEVAAKTKDVMVMTQAVHNTLLINAVILSWTDESVIQPQIDMLCTYTKYRAEGKHKLPDDTYDILLRKIDPNNGERERKTVQALLYTGGEDGGIPPRLWIGLSTGKIKVYSGITFMLDTEFLQAKGSCVACLTSVGERQVWAGSNGIYIIDVQTITCKKTMMDHSDLVVDIVVKDMYVYTASLDGTIIKWDSHKLTHAMPKIDVTHIGKEFSNLRSIKIHGDKLICGTWTKLLICDLNGKPISTLTITDPEDTSRVTELDSFIALDNNEIWAGYRREGKLVVWDCKTGLMKETISMPDCSKGVSIMKQVDGKVWVGTKDGLICIYTVKHELWKQLQAHDDAVRVLCDVRDRYVISGGGSKDGKVAIWNASPASNTDSGNFDSREEFLD